MASRYTNQKRLSMSLKQINEVSVILGSQSPRRKELLAAMDINFVVEVFPTEEQVDLRLSPEEIAEQIARNKLIPFETNGYEDKLVITADTIVVSPKGDILGKPQSIAEAMSAIAELSGQEHLVITGVAIRFKEQYISFAEKTRVRFRSLDEQEIRYYVDKYHPMDKAGSYGIQEWIGRIGIESIEGSYENVMGLPTQRLYAELKRLIQQQ